MGLSDLSNGRRMHSLKRRKLAHSTSSIVSDSSVSLPSPPQLGMKGVVCASCHRAFPVAKQSLLVQCARCHAPTCTICSRTCNGCPPSMPPTPELTMSPSTVSPASPGVGSPDAAASLSVSLGNLDDSDGMAAERERRPALASHTNVAGTVGRRRKQREHDDVDEEGRKGSGESEDERMKEAGILPGCGRVVCRGCSFETPESDLNTCYDCASRSPFQT